MAKRKHGPALPECLTVPEAAARLGFKAATVYAWVAARKIPVVRVGHAVRIRAEVVAALVHEVPAKADA